MDLHDGWRAEYGELSDSSGLYIVREEDGESTISIILSSLYTEGEYMLGNDGLIFCLELSGSFVTQSVE